jgi:MFS family permease
VTKPYEALRHRDFRRLWVAQLISQLGSQMQVTAMNWHVYLLTHSPLALGFVGLTRVVPIILFSLWGGLEADRRDRRRLLLLTQSVQALVALGLALMTISGRSSVWLIYGLNAVQAAAWSFDNPARAAFVPKLVPVRDLPGALALNLTVFHVAMIGGPALAGALLAGGAGWLSSYLSQDDAALFAIYGLNAASFSSVLLALALMRISGRAEGEARANADALQSLREGLRFVFTTPLMVWTMTLDFFATFFAGSLSLLPVFADQVLGVGAAGYGWLVAAPGIGALLGSLFTSVSPLPRRQGPLLLWSVAAYGAATIVYGISRSYTLTLLALAGTGLADLVSTVIRQTLRQLITPDSLRGRMTSVNMIFFMGGPQLGEMEAGLVASLFASAATGVTVSVVSGGFVTLLVAAYVAAATPLVRRYDTHALQSSA